KEVIHLGSDIRAMAISPDGTRAVIQRTSGPAQLWSLSTRKQLGTLSNRSPRIRFEFGSDNKTLFYIEADRNRCSLWDIAAGRERAVLNFPEDKDTSISFSPNGTRLAVGEDRLVSVWDTATGQQLLKLRGHEARVVQMSFSPDGRRIASAGNTDRT